MCQARVLLPWLPPSSMKRTTKGTWGGEQKGTHLKVVLQLSPQCSPQSQAGAAGPQPQISQSYLLTSGVFQAPVPLPQLGSCSLA